jgi:hypothetical protein
MQFESVVGKNGLKYENGVIQKKYQCLLPQDPKQL